MSKKVIDRYRKQLYDFFKVVQLNKLQPIFWVLCDIMSIVFFFPI